MDKAQERDEQAQHDLQGWAEDFVAARHWLRLGEEAQAQLVGDLYRELRSAYIKGAADGAADVGDAFREGR
jgi:hypothetical protein